MLKKAMIILGYSILWTVILCTLLILTKSIFLDHLVLFIRKIRGTAGYEKGGEGNAQENLTVIVGMAWVIFALMLVLFTFLKRKKK